LSSNDRTPIKWRHSGSHPEPKFRQNPGLKSELIELKNAFIKTIDIVESNIPRAFRLVRALNAAVFDSAMVGLARRLADGGPIDKAHIRPAYDKLLADPDYRQACERSTADEENVKRRLGKAIAAFMAV
jgi:hypothetical protein